MKIEKTIRKNPVPKKFKENRTETAPNLGELFPHTVFEEEYKEAPIVKPRDDYEPSQRISDNYKML